MVFKKRAYITTRQKIYIFGAGTVVALFGLLMTLSYYGVSVTDFQGNPIPDKLCAGTADEPCVQEIKLCSANYAIAFSRDIDVQLNDSSVTYNIKKNDTLNRWRYFSFKGKTLNAGECWYLKLYVEKRIDQSVKWGLDYQTGVLDPIFEGYVKEDFFVSLDKNDAGIGNGYAEFTLRNPTTFDITSMDLSKFNFYVRWNNTPILTYNLFILKNVSYLEPIIVQKYIDKTCIKQDCAYDNSSCKSIYYNCSYWDSVQNGTITKYRMEWEPLSIETFKKQREYKIRIEATWIPNQIIYNDWVPFILISGITYEMPSWQWWNVSYTNRINVNITTNFANYSGINPGDVLLILNSTNWGNSACQNSACNDSAITWLNNSIEQQIPFWIENYSAMGDSYIWLRVPILNNSNNQFYIYYNSTANKSFYNNASKVSWDFWDFENFSDSDVLSQGTQTKGGFGSIDLAIGIPRINSTIAFRGSNSLSLRGSNTVGIMYGWGSNTTQSGIVSFWFRTNNSQSDATYYVTNWVNGTWGGAIKSVAPQNISPNWVFAKLQWNGSNASGTIMNFTNNGTTRNIVGSPFYPGNQMFPYHIVAAQPVYIDEIRFYNYLPQDLIIKTFGGIEIPSFPIIITLNYPNNNTQNITTSNIEFGFTPIFYGGEPQKCNLWTNESNWGEPICYQEYANVSTACGGKIGKYNLISGWYSDAANATDGNWTTGGIMQDNAVLQINYTKPNNNSGSIWQVKYGNISTGTSDYKNISIPDICLNASIPNLQLWVWFSGFPPSTYNLKFYCSRTGGKEITDFEFLFKPTNTGDLFYEEAMWWSMIIPIIPINNTLNNITYNFSTEGNYTWGIGCWNKLSQNFSGNRTITIDTIGPSIPTNLTNSTIGLTWINITWDASTDFSGIQKYLIFRNGTNIANTTALSYNATGLTNSSFYRFNVSAMDGVGNIGANASAFLNTIDITPPTAPSNLRNLTFASSFINITWNAAIDDFGIQRYLIYRNGTYIANTTVLSYNDTGLSEYTWYRYNVSAMDNYNNIGPNATLVVRTKDVTPPTAPTAFSSQRGLTNISLIWTASTDTGSGVAGYIIFRNGSNIANSSVVNYTDTTCNVGTSYSYIVEAYDNDGNKGINSSTIVNSTYTANIIVTLPTGTGKYVLNATGQTGTYQPFNQTSSVPIFKVNYSGEIAPTMIYIKLNQTLDTCMQAYFMPNNSAFNISQSWNVSTTAWVPLIELANNSIQNMWSYVKYNNCAPGQTFTRRFIFGL